MKSAEIRRKFIDFFIEQGHTAVESSPVIPADDPTLLFTNAGMNQFKDLFLGHEKRSYTRAVSIQKCIRAGGKHNDLDNVGFTSRHLTFFEMMGNFSFGDYFKKDAIRFAWLFLTEKIGLDANRLYVSVFHQDTEAYELWRSEIGIPERRIIKLGAQDNFWQMGDTGPCGPCSEIYVDRGAHYGCGSSRCLPGCACNRFLEIWNLVFMQYNRQTNGTDVPLAQTGVDTGMGLDRLTMIMQHKDSVFATDLFAPIIEQIELLTGVSYHTSTQGIQSAFHVVADHIRSTAFALADGAVPAPDGRGYVIRKIIRRAALFSQKLSNRLFFPQLIDGLIASLGAYYPGLAVQRDTIIRILTEELEQFSRNLHRGTTLLEQHIAQHTDTMSIPGSVAFTLYDTYGFPLEITKVIAHEHGKQVDEQGFSHQMEQQRLMSAQRSESVVLPLPSESTTRFTGYTETTTTATVRALFCGETAVESAPAGSLCWVVPTACPFYVASGGQVDDAGMVMIHEALVPITGLMKQGRTIAFSILLPHQLSVGETITMRVDEQRRRMTMKNHTATHLLQSALMTLFGKARIKQAGSLVSPEYLRFDVTCPEQPTTEQINALETIINGAIQDNIPVAISTSTLAEAQNLGAVAFFGDKYNPESVRIVTIPQLSTELCGGTHVAATGEIGLCKIVEVTALAAGIRRFVAITGPAAVQWAQKKFQTMRGITQLLKTDEANAPAAVEKLQLQLKEAQLLCRSIRNRLWHATMPEWIRSRQRIGEVDFGMIIIDDTGVEELRELSNKLIQQAPGIWCLVGTESDHERISFVIATANQLETRYPLKELLKSLSLLGLRGGGSARCVQGSAPLLPERLEETITEWIAQAYSRSAQ